MKPTLSQCDENCPLQPPKRNKNINPKKNVCGCLSTCTPHYSIKTKIIRDFASIFRAWGLLLTPPTPGRFSGCSQMGKNLIDSRQAPTRATGTDILPTHWMTKCYAPVNVGCDRSILRIEIFL